MLVPAHHQIDAVLVEQGNPFLADPEVGAIGFVGGRDGDLVHAHDDPVDRRVAPGRSQFGFQPRLLSAPRIAPHIGVAAVLVGDVVVGDADHPHRAGGEGVPEPARHLGLARRLGQLEVGLVGLIADRPVAEFVLVVTGRRHPRPPARAAAVVGPEIPPGAHPVVGEVGVAEIAVEQVEQRLQPLDPHRHVARRRRSKIVVHIQRTRQGDARRRLVLAAQRGRALVAEAGEGESRAAARRGAEGAEQRRRAFMQRAVEVRGVGAQAAKRRMMREHGLTGLGVGVAHARGRYDLLELAVQPPEQHPRALNRLQRVPRHHHLRRRIRTELQMQPGDRWGRDRIGRCLRGPGGRGLGPLRGGGAPPTTPAAASSLRRLSSSSNPLSGAVITGHAVGTSPTDLSQFCDSSATSDGRGRLSRAGAAALTPTVNHRTSTAPRRWGNHLMGGR